MRYFYALLILATGASALADTLYLKDGKVVGGTYLGGTARQVRMDLGDRVASYDIADGAKIEFQSVAASAPQPEREDPRERPPIVGRDPEQPLSTSRAGSLDV